MKILAIETSSTACSLAVCWNGNSKSVHTIMPMQQTQHVLPMIESLLKETDITLAELNAIAFGCGPGSFTGVRVAVSVAQGLGYALSIPLIPVSSLAGLAQAAADELGWKKLLVAVDARMQEIYCGAYIVNPEGLVQLQQEERVCLPQTFTFVADRKWYGVGDAWGVYQEQFSVKPTEYDVTRMPMAAGILKLAQASYLKKEWVQASDAMPTYLRNDVAKKSQN